jgi:hypothetical protein
MKSWTYRASRTYIQIEKNLFSAVLEGNPFNLNHNGQDLEHSANDFSEFALNRHVQGYFVGLGC